jgi:methylated-DNA-[protein]-cysteine S-methyltransferase
MRRCEIETPAGVLEVHYTDKGVTRICLPPRTGSARPTPPPMKEPGMGFMRRFSNDLTEYFEGKNVVFSPPLDLGGAGRFDRSVFAILRSIPYGEVRSYGWVAGKMGVPGAALAVGGACRRNPCPIVIPCHRVIEASGDLGGYSGGLAWKRYLLDLENK